MFNTIDQVKGAPSTSENYGFVSSRAVLDTFERRGWTVDSIQTSKVKNAENEGYQKHLVWLKNPNIGMVPGLSKNNESVPRLCLVNSHDASSSLMIFFGLLRVACLNQIVTGNVFRFFRAVHSKNVIGRIDQGIEYMSEGLPALYESIQRLQNTRLSLDQRIEYARLMATIRLENVRNVVSVNYNRLEDAVREEDRNQDAYTVLNRVQEYVIRGGIPYTYRRDLKNDQGAVVESRLISTATKKIASIPSQLKLNRALFENIEKVAA